MARTTVTITVEDGVLTVHNDETTPLLEISPLSVLEAVVASFVNKHPDVDRETLVDFRTKAASALRHLSWAGYRVVR